MSGLVGPNPPLRLRLRLSLSLILTLVILSRMTTSIPGWAEGVGIQLQDFPSAIAHEDTYHGSRLGVCSY